MSAEKPMGAVMKGLATAGIFLNFAGPLAVPSQVRSGHCSATRRLITLSCPWLSKASVRSRVP